MGAAKPQALELVPTSDRRTPTARDAARRNYQRLLERVLTRHFIGSKVDGLRSAMDLEHSFGPAYVRGRLLQGTAADAVIGVGEAESGAIIDGILTLGILWLDYCRQHGDGRRHFGGLKVIVPAGAWRTTAERMAWLNHAAADFQLFTLDERSEELAPVDFRDTGNLESRLVHAFSAAGRHRALPGRASTACWRWFRPAQASALRFGPAPPPKSGCCCTASSLRACATASPPTPLRAKMKSPSARAPTRLRSPTENEALCRELFARLFLSRHADGAHTDPLFRLQPERWLESRLRAGIAELLPGLRGDLLYSQVPALSTGDRGMLDLLTLDRNGRLAVIELKADEDLHLPLQALDYWIRVRALNDDRQPAAGRRQAALGLRAPGLLRRR